MKLLIAFLLSACGEDYCHKYASNYCERYRQCNGLYPMPGVCADSLAKMIEGSDQGWCKERAAEVVTAKCSDLSRL